MPNVKHSVMPDDFIDWVGWAWERWVQRHPVLPGYLEQIEGETPEPPAELEATSCPAAPATKQIGEKSDARQD